VHHRVTVRPQPPLRTRNRGDDHAAQEKARLGEGSVDPGRPAQLAGGLTGGVVDGLVEQGKVLRAAVKFESVGPGEGAQLVTRPSSSPSCSGSGRRGTPYTTTPRASPCLGPGIHRRHRLLTFPFSRPGRSWSSVDRHLLSLMTCNRRAGPAGLVRACGPRSRRSGSCLAGPFYKRTRPGLPLPGTGSHPSRWR
jgi:hypothetical protein